MVESSGQGMNRLLAFDYTNWRGDDHYYIVQPQSIGLGKAEEDKGELVLNAFLVTRDGDLRLELGNIRRRSFIVNKIRNLKEVP